MIYCINPRDGLRLFFRNPLMKQGSTAIIGPVAHGPSGGVARPCSGDASGSKRNIGRALFLN